MVLRESEKDVVDIKKRDIVAMFRQLLWIYCIGICKSCSEKKKSIIIHEILLSRILSHSFLLKF